jgi:hypothetical protein
LTEKEAFSNLSALITLDLSKNKIKKISVESLIGLNFEKSLRILSLLKNNISFISAYLADDFIHLNEFSLDNSYSLEKVVNDSHFFYVRGQDLSRRDLFEKILKASRRMTRLEYIYLIDNQIIVIKKEAIMSVSYVVYR